MNSSGAKAESCVIAGRHHLTPMRTKLTAATALSGALLATCLLSGSAHATYYGYGAPYGYYVYGIPYGYDGYGVPNVAAGPDGGRCDWYYRNAIATDRSYWWDRYQKKCAGYY